MRGHYFLKSGIISLFAVFALLGGSEPCGAQTRDRQPDGGNLPARGPSALQTQSGQRTRRLPLKSNRPSIAKAIQTSTGRVREPIVVLPQNREFDTLQGAIDFCSGSAKRTGPTGGSRLIQYIVVSKGRHDGNWSLPPDTVLVGPFGPEMTVLVGKPNVNEPVIKVVASGATEFEYGLTGLSILAQQNSGVWFQGNASASEFEIDNCGIGTIGPAIIPAVKVTGSGTSGERLEFDIANSDLGTDTGVAFEIVVDGNTTVRIEDCNLSGELGAIDARSSSTTWQDAIEMVRCDLEGESSSTFAMKVDNISMMMADTSVHASNGPAIEISGNSSGGRALFDRCRFYCDSANGIDVSGVVSLTMKYSEVIIYGSSGHGIRSQGVPVVSIYYCGFFTPQGIDISGGTTKTLFYSHWNGVLL